MFIAYIQIDIVKFGTLPRVSPLYPIQFDPCAKNRCNASESSVDSQRQRVNYKSVNGEMMVEYIFEVNERGQWVASIDRRDECRR